jgi:hypothetical protein
MPPTDSLLRSLRASAQGAGARALDAGATTAERARGDTAFAAAETLAAHGQMPDAMVQLATAASLWGEAERVARARAAREAEQRRAAEQTAPPPPPAAPATPADPRADIQRTIDDYARALESRDVGQIRRAYPGLTAAQQQSWRDFFGSVRNLKATLSVTAVSVAGATADAVVSGVYEYDNARTGRVERRPVTFRALLSADQAGWRLTAIR